MHLYQPPCDGQSQAGADALASSVARLEKLSENCLVILGRNPRTRIGNGDRYAAVTWVDPHRDSALARELDGVAHDIADDLAYAARVGEGRRGLARQLQREPFGAGGDACLTHDLLRDRIDVD